MGFEPPSLRLLSANAGKSDRSNPVTFSLPSGWRTHTEHFINNNNNNNNSELQLKHWEVFSAPVPLKMLLERELFMLKPGFLFTPNPDILTHKHTHRITLRYELLQTRRFNTDEGFVGHG